MLLEPHFYCLPQMRDFYAGFRSPYPSNEWVFLKMWKRYPSDEGFSRWIQEPISLKRGIFMYLSSDGINQLVGYCFILLFVLFRPIAIRNYKIVSLSWNKALLLHENVHPKRHKSSKWWSYSRWTCVCSLCSSQVWAKHSWVLLPQTTVSTLGGSGVHL